MNKLHWKIAEATNPLAYYIIYVAMPMQQCMVFVMIMYYERVFINNNLWNLLILKKVLNNY